MNELTERHTFVHDIETIHAKAIAFCKADNVQVTADGLLQIVLFYLNVYEVTKDKLLINNVHSLMDYYLTIIRKNTADCSLTTGKAGFLYAATRLHEMDITDSFLEKAITEIEEGIQNFIISPYTDNTVFSGRAGCVLALQYYYAVTNDDKAFPRIEALIEKMIAEIQATDKGFFWKDRVEQLNGLLNFEQGNAGIGYTFLELAENYRQEDFLQIAKQLYSYQSQFWNAAIGLKATKKGIENKQTYQLAIEAVKNEDTSYFEPLTNTIFILVGVTRFTLHLWQKTKDETIKNDLTAYLIKCQELFEASKASLSTKKAVLLGTLFLEASKALEDEQYKVSAEKAIEIIQNHANFNLSENFTDFVLQVKNVQLQLAFEYPNITTLIIPKNKIQAKKNLEVHTKESMLQNTFPRTVAFLKTHNEQLLSTYIAQPIQEKAILNFMMFIKKNLNQFPPIQKKQLSELLKLEISIQNLKKSVKNYAFLEATNIHTYQTVQALFNKEDTVFLNTSLQLNPKAKKLQTAWNWDVKQHKFSDKNSDIAESKNQVFLFPYYTTIVTEYWQHSHNVVLDYFENQIKVKDALAQLTKFYQSQNAIFIDNFSQFIMAESSYVLENLDIILSKIIKEYMAIGLLEIVTNTTKSN